MSEYFLIRQMQLALYALKRQYGGPIVVFHLLESSVDSKTGEPATKTLATRIPLAIILPAKINREVQRNISLISANKQMVMGGSVDANKRVFIIERRDAPSLLLAKDDWISYGGNKYAIESIEEYEFRSAWVVVAKHLLGETAPAETLAQTISSADVMNLGGEAGEEVV